MPFDVKLPDRTVVFQLQEHLTQNDLSALMQSTELQQPLSRSQKTC